MPRTLASDAAASLHDRPALGEWPGMFVRAGKKSLEHDVPMLASALAYNAFFAIPATLLVAAGLFSLTTERATIDDLMDRLRTVAPDEAVDLLGTSLQRLGQQHSAGIVMTLVGFALALWATSGAVTTAMTAINRAHERDDRRGFVKKRLIALLLVVSLGTALVLLAVLLVLGPHVEGWIGSALDAEAPVTWIWWSAQWPVLIAALLTAFSALFALSANEGERSWRLVTPGSAIAVAVWLVASAAFAFYASRFGSYNKTWGSLSGVIVMLTWLWLSGIALLFGAEVDAEAERTRRGRLS